MALSTPIKSLSFGLMAVSFWAVPSVGFAAPAKAPPAGNSASAKAEAIVKKACEATRRARTLSADETYSVISGKENASSKRHALLMKPNFIYTVTDNRMENVGDGKILWEIDFKQKRYYKLPDLPVAFRSVAWLEELFFVPDEMMVFLHGKHQALGLRTVDGKNYQAVQFTVNGALNVVNVAYFDPATDLLAGMDTTDSTPGNSYRRKIWLKNVRANVPIKPSQFYYMPQRGYTMKKDLR